MMIKMFPEDMMVKHALAGLCMNTISQVGWVVPPPMLHSYACLLLAGDKNEHLYLPNGGVNSSICLPNVYILYILQLHSRCDIRCMCEK